MGGIFLLPLIPLIVASSPFFPSLFFPYITGKNFAFRILVELLFAGWLFMALRDASYRPRRSLLLLAVTVFAVVVALADVFSVNSHKSIWSNYERMEGLVTILHLAGYFVVAASVLTTEKLWERFWQVSLGAAAVASLYALAQVVGWFPMHQGDRPEATLGNATYLAGYLLFNFFIALYYTLRSRGGSILPWVYGGLALLFAVCVYLTATRGAMLGLLGGLGLAALIMVLFARDHRRLRLIAAGGLAAVIVLAGTVALARNTDFVRENHVLGRLSSISIQNEDAQTRFLIWNMAWQGFKEKPLLGWGQENFNFVFNTHYDPRLYSRETWFDRVHNIFLDWLVAGGALGLLAYLGLYAAALWTLWRRGGGLLLVERAALTGLIAAYAIHNFFVFDNIVSYLLFFSLLAYIAVRSSAAAPPLFGARTLDSGTANRVVAPALVVLMLFALYALNVKGLLVARDIVQGLKQQEGGLQVNLAQFEQALARDSFGAQEVREQLATVANRLASLDADPALKQQFFDLARAEMQKQIDAVPDDARFQLFMASLLDTWQQYDAAIPYLESALQLSPRKQVTFFEIGSNLLNQGREADALVAFKAAYELEPRFSDAAILYAVGAIYARQPALAEDILQERFGTNTVSDSRLLQAYTRMGQFGKLRQLWEGRAAAEPGNWQYRVQLAAVYLALGERSRSIAELQKAIELNPEFKAQGERFIEEIRAGRNP